MFSFFQMLSYPRAYVCITYNKRQIPLSYVQTGATLLVNNSLHCWMLHVGSVCAPCCILLDVVACCCAKFKTCQTFSTVQTGATLLGDVASVCTQPYSRELFLSNVFLSMCICMHNLWKDKRQIPRRTSRGLLWKLKQNTYQNVQFGNSSGGFIRSTFNQKFSLLSPYFNPFSPESGQCQAFKKKKFKISLS